MKFKESQLAHKYLDGKKGIEIGASAHNAFNIEDCIYVDRYAELDTVFKKEEVKLCGELVIPDVIASGDDLPFEDSTFDYVLSSHVLEHFYDTIGTLKEWKRVTKNGGIIFFVFPHKNRTMDVNEERTSLSELIERHENINTYNDSEDKHHTFWITEDALELCQYMNLKVLEFLDVDDKVGNGFTVVIEVEK